MKIIDGKKLSEEILLDVKNEVAQLHFQPIFCDILVGDDPASIQYVKMKARWAEKVGIHFHKANFPSSITTAELAEEIKKINKIPHMCGIITQLPLPEFLDKRVILDSIDPRLDVDCLGSVASDKFYNESTEIGFPTALACMKLLDSLGLDSNPSTALENKKIVVLGQGMLVGKPVTALLKFRGLNPVVVTSKTENKLEIIKEADIIISGIGQGKYLKRNMIKNGAVLIDAGTSESVEAPKGEKANIVGDVDLESMKDVEGYVSPVPGGVGPVTVAMLLNNVLTVAKNISIK